MDNPKRKVTCQSCGRRIGVQTRNGTTKIVRHRATATKVPGELPGHYAACAGSGVVIARAT